MKWLKDQGLDQNTIVIFTTDNGAEVFTWPDGGTPFAGSRGMVKDGGYRVPAIVKRPGHVPAGSVSNGIISGLDWHPTLTSIAGNPNVKDQLIKGLTLDGKNYRSIWTVLTRPRC
jgi:arylsulfatase